MRKLFKIGIIGAALATVAKLVKTKVDATHRYFSQGTESELRERVRDKFGDKVPEEKLQEVEDKVIDHARKRGTLSDSAADAAE